MRPATGNLTGVVAARILPSSIVPRHSTHRMNRIGTKTTAESVLRELPSVLGAHVSEDPDGRPREIHLLVRHGPDPARLARDIRSLLEERLGIPIDQRVISIAQMEHDPTDDAPEGIPVRSEDAGVSEPAPDSADTRPAFAGMESRTTAGQVRITVRLEWHGEASEGAAEALDTRPGRARAAATATLRSAIGASWNQDLDLELDFASIVPALEREYMLVSVLAMSSRLGRRPLDLVGAHPVDSDLESATALATLKAINRVLSGYSSTSSERSAK